MSSSPAPCPHEWSIADREYARQEERRGRRYAFERLDPSKTALVVIDMVPFFIADNPYALGIVDNVNALATAMRGVGGIVSWVLPGPNPPQPSFDEFFGARVAEMFRAEARGPLRPRLWAGLSVQDEDLLVEKTTFSAFFPGRCPLPDELARRGIENVLIAGCVTNVCCESSARDAATRGYRVLMVADANATTSDAVHNATLHTIYRSFGDVRPTQDVLALIGAST